MKSKNLKPILLSVGVITMSLAVNFAFAWTEPAGAPPTGNVSAPVNVSSTGQTKAGALTVQGNLTAPIFYDGNDSNYYVNPAGQTILAGSVGIGTGITTPTNTLQVKDLINFPNSVQGTFLGYQAGNVNTGTNNTFVGHQAGRVNTTGHLSTAIGSYALSSNTSGDVNTAIGSYALHSNTEGYGNTAIGDETLRFNTTGWRNIAIGVTALYLNTTGYRNIAVGHEVLFANTTGGGNVALGVETLRSNTTGSSNVAVGNDALWTDATGSANIAVGDASLKNTIGSSNTALGFRSGYNSLGSGNVFLGSYAGAYETGSNSFYVDNQDRANTAGDKSKALMYGTFDALPANQTLTINASVNVAGAFTVNGSPVGGGGTNYWTQTGTTLYPSTTSWQPLFGSTANSANYPYAAMISSKGAAGSATGALIGVAGEALSDGTKNASGILGIGKASGAYSGKGIEGVGYVSASADTAGAYGGYFYANSTHSGGINVGGYGYANYSSNENYGLRGVAVTPSTGATYVTIGAYGQGTTYGSTSATGIYGRGSVAATGDTASAYGGIFLANDTHAGGPNYGIYSYANGSGANYSFYGDSGVLYNYGNVGIGLGRSAPVYALDVIRIAPNVARFTSTGTGTGPDVLIVDQDNDNTRAALQIQGNGGSSEVLFASSVGNVGIGTTTPAALLDLYKTGLAQFQITGTTQSSYDLYGGAVRLQASAANSLGGYFGTVSNHALNLVTNDSVRMTILNTSGNVGIGTATPGASYKLDVNGNVNVTGTLNVTGGMTPRVGTITDSAAPIPNAATDDIFTVTALAQAATFGAPSGTPVNGQKLIIRIKDNGTARTLAWNAIYRAGDAVLPTTTILGKTMYLGFIYNSADSKWDFVSLTGNF